MSTRYLWDKYDTKKVWKQSDALTAYGSLESEVSIAHLCNDYEARGPFFYEKGEVHQIQASDQSGSGQAARARTSDYRYALLNSAYPFSSTQTAEPVLAECTDTSCYWVIEAIFRNNIRRYVLYQSTSSTVSYDTVKAYKFYVLVDEAQRGETLQGQVSSGSQGAYPEDGLSGSSWYVSRGSDSIDPAGVSYSTDKLEREQPVTIRVEPRRASYTWETVDVPGTGLIGWDACAYGNGRFVAIGLEPRGRGIAAVSTDGAQWTTTILPSDVAGVMNAICFDGGRFVAAADPGGGQTQFPYSSDGENWTPGTTIDLPISTICYGGGMYIAFPVTNSAQTPYVYSTDGISWKTSALPIIDGSWERAAYGGGKFVVISSCDKFAYSANGLNWTVVNVSASLTWCAIAYGNGRFVAVSNYAAASSTDGVNWKVSAVRGRLVRLVFGNGKFIALGYDGIFSSIDGVSWEEEQSPPPLESRSWYNLACGGDGTLVSTSQTGRIAYARPPLGGAVYYQYQYSTDGGKTWTSIGSKTTATEVTVTVPKTAEQFMARVQASDGLGFTSADYVYGPNAAVQVMKLWTGVEGKARKGRALWIGVDGKARKVVHGWVGDSAGRARKWF